MKNPILSFGKKKVIFLGNEAVVRGALESGVQFVTTYPGTPASEIGDTFFKISQERDVYFEYSTNEKVALEVAAGAAFSGLRALCAMKHFGLNVACDFLMPLVYSGTKGGIVIVVVDDPGCSSSAQSEQDSRAFSYLAHIPTLEPSTPQECKDFTKLAFSISEKYQIPVLLRQTTRVALQRGSLLLGKIKKDKRKAKFVKDPHQFITMPPRVLEMKRELLEKVEKIRKEISEKSLLNKVFQVSGLKDLKGVGVIASGVAFLYAMEAAKELNLNVPVLKIGSFYPLPENKIKNFIKGLKRVLVVEELEPYLEKEVERLAKDINPRLKIFGKDIVPQVGELKPDDVIQALAGVTGRKQQTLQSKLHQVKKRPPQLCPGCPYWLVFQGVKRAVGKKKVVFGGEIGCYMIAGLFPHYLQDYLYCMGSSVSIAHGIKKASKNRQKVISFVGDSSFFHSGIPALLNAVHNGSNPLVIILNNQTTGMTGHQPHPGVGLKTKRTKLESVEIEKVVRALGVKYVKVVDPFSQEEFIKTIKDFLNKKEVSVIIAKHPCIFVD